VYQQSCKLRSGQQLCYFCTRPSPGAGAARFDQVESTDGTLRPTGGFHCYSAKVRPEWNSGSHSARCPRAGDQREPRLVEFTVNSRTDTAVAIDAVFRGADGRMRRFGLKCSLGSRSFAPGRYGMLALLRLAAPCRFAILPTFSRPTWWSMRAKCGRKCGDSSENFLLHMVGQAARS